MPRPDLALEAEVTRRGNGRCEYCHFPVAVADLPFHIVHIIAAKHHGPTTSANLAWACFSCNLRKGPNIAGIDPLTGDLTRLFHPRTDIWDEHFEWEEELLRGKTAVRRTTVVVLNINDPDSVAVRRAMKHEGIFDG